MPVLCLRYEMHIEEVKPEDLSAGFLREFIALPSVDDNGENYNKYREYTDISLIYFNHFHWETWTRIHTGYSFLGTREFHPALGNTLHKVGQVWGRVGNKENHDGEWGPEQGRVQRNNGGGIPEHFCKFQCEKGEKKRIQLEVAVSVILLFVLRSGRKPRHCDNDYGYRGSDFQTRCERLAQFHSGLPEAVQVHDGAHHWTIELWDRCIVQKRQIWFWMRSAQKQACERTKLRKNVLHDCYERNWNKKVLWLHGSTELDQSTGWETRSFEKGDRDLLRRGEANESGKHFLHQKFSLVGFLVLFPRAERC